MTRWFLSGVLVLLLAGFADCEMDAAAVASSAEMKPQVFRYLTVQMQTKQPEF